MVNWTDRKYVNPRKRVFKNMETDEIINVEIQDDLTNIETESETPLNAEMLNLAQQELKQDTLDEVDEKISNLETLPSGGTTGQVLSKASNENGDAQWRDIEANEVHIGNVDTAPDSAKLIIENGDVDEDESFIVPKNAGAHNSIYREKNITELFYNGTLSQQIAAGTFDDIFVGDYIIGQTSGRKYLVADVNYRLHTGDTECTTPHVLMIPEKIMGTAKMNNANITTGAYTGSKMYTEYLASFKTAIQNDFGNAHILKHKALLTNTVTDGKSSAWTWCDSTIELMNESMVYGHNVFGSHSGYETGIDKSQLSLFKLNKSKIVAQDDAGTRYWYWLRDVASASSFASIHISGAASYTSASEASGVRPAFLVY